MNARHLSGLLVVAANALAKSRNASALSPATNTVATTLSTSRQFTAYADNPLLPSALCVYAERVKHEWLRRMDVPDNWRDPILLVVHTRETAQTNAPAISMVTIQTDVHLKYQVRCLVPPALDEAKLLVAVVDALSSEWANREQPIIRGHLYTAPVMPLWLVEGIAASIQGQFEFLLSIARRSVAAGRPESAADVMGVRVLPVDAADRQLFQADAWLLTESILALPDGSRKLRSFLSELGARKAVGSAFWTVYHRDFPQSAALDEWWSREQARRTSVTMAQDLSAAETGRRLATILIVKLGPVKEREGTPERTEATLGDLWQYTEEPWLVDVLKLKTDQLGTLRGLAHPVYRPWWMNTSRR